jgi:hypothetical protein
VWARIAIAAVLAGFAVVPAGCGGDGSGEEPKSSSSLAAQPAAKAPLSGELAAFDRAIAAQSCPLLTRLRFSVVRGRPPSAPPAGDECRGRNPSLEALRGRRFTRAAQFGTAGVMAGKPGARAGYAIWALDTDGRYRFTGVSGGASQEIGTSFARRREAQDVGRGFVAATRRGDCGAMAPLLSPGSRLVYGQPDARAGCRVVVRGRIFAPALRATTRPRVTVMGGTAHLAFVGVATKRRWFTVVLSDVHGRALRVLDVLPAS